MLIMNKRMILYIVGWVLKVLGLLMLLPCIVALIYQENTLVAFLLPIAFCLIIGVLLTYKKPQNRRFYTKEGFVTVALVWILLSVVGALPFIISGEIADPINAIFETISGFTTTGASILNNVEALSKSMMFWRSFTHWIGGLGVLVFVLAFMPQDDSGSSMNIMRAESPGPVVGKLVPHIRRTAFILYAIYFVMTVIQIIVLCISGLPLFDSLCISFGSAGTGGFGIYNDSMASMPAHILNIVAVFMILFGVNFNVYYFLLLRKFKEAFKHEEMRYYFLIIACAVGLIMINIYSMFSSLSEVWTHSFFQFASIITTTGYSSVDFELWPSFSKAILLFLMFVGACAGSTGGGFKVSRFVMMVKSGVKEVGNYIHPRQVKKIRMEGKSTSDEQVLSVTTYLAIYVCILMLSVLLISLDNFDFTTNFSAVMATFNNIGPGLGAVGPMSNFDVYSVFSKLVLMFDMLAGRLELIPILLLFNPKTWKK